MDAHATAAIHVVLMQAISMRLPGPMPAHTIQHVHVPIWEDSRWGGNGDAVYNRGTVATHVVLMGIKLVGFPPETNY